MAIMGLCEPGVAAPMLRAVRSKPGKIEAVLKSRRAARVGAGTHAD